MALLPAIWVTVIITTSLRLVQRDPDITTSTPRGASPIEVLLLALIGLLALDTLFFLARSRRFTRLGVGLGLLFAYTALAVLSTSWSSTPSYTFARSAQVGYVALVAYTSTAVWKQGQRHLGRDWRSIWLGFMAVMGFLLIWSILFPVDWPQDRFTLFGSDPFTTGALLAITVAIGFSMFLEPSWMLTSSHRWLVGIVTTGAFVGMLFSRTRSALFGLVLGSALMLLFWTRRREGPRPLIFPGFAVLAVALWAAAFNRIWLFILREQTSEQFSSGTGRTDLIEPALEMFQDKPFFGAGYAAGRFAFLEDVGAWATHGHNIIIEFAVDLGLTGIVICVGLMAWTVIFGIRLHRQDPGHLSGSILGWFGVSLLVWITEHGFALPSYSLTLLALVVGALTAAVRPPQAKESILGALQSRRRAGAAST